jgi:NADH-quinone oxidoreductase subunit J
MTVFFWIFAALVAGAALLAITRRNAVAAALWAAVAFVGIAGEFVLMHAYFVAVVEVLVYAGAIMVLFLFVIMLLNLREEDIKAVEGPRLHIVGVIFAVLFLAALVWTCKEAGLYSVDLGTPSPAGETKHVAEPLFAHYVLPFEIASFLLLSAIVGSVLITKRRLR